MALANVPAPSGRRARFLPVAALLAAVLAACAGAAASTVAAGPLASTPPTITG